MWISQISQIQFLAICWFFSSVAFVLLFFFCFLLVARTRLFIYIIVCTNVRFFLTVNQAQYLLNWYLQNECDPSLRELSFWCCFIFLFLSLDFYNECIWIEMKLRKWWVKITQYKFSRSQRSPRTFGAVVDLYFYFFHTQVWMNKWMMNKIFLNLFLGRKREIYPSG